MPQNKRRNKISIDGILILLFSLVIAILLLFFYLKSIDKNSKYYYTYKKNVQKLHLYNQELNNVFIRTYKYLDNDYITVVGKNFDDALIALEDNPLTELFGDKVIHGVHEIVKRYNQKIDFIESFKTLNARVTGSIYYLDELKKQIEDNKMVNMKIKRLLSNILFKIEQVFLDTDFDTNILNDDVNLLRVNRTVDEDIEYFIKHVEQFLMDVEQINTILKEQQKLRTAESISHLNQILEVAYMRNQKQEKSIGTIFFIFAFIVLLSLIYTYAKMRKQSKELFYLAYHDTLTHLPNRTEFERHLDKLILKSQKPFTLLFIDLDRFKGINDTLGHDVGDEMLIVLAKRICNVLGEKNMLVRLGGDEFIAIIERKKDIENIDKLIKIIASSIRKPIRIREYNLNTTGSIGIAKYPQDGFDRHTLLKHADLAMYHAKDKGRDTYAFYTEALSINVQRRLVLEQELIHALRKKEFTLYYQPQYRLSTREITGVEALVRWQNNTLGNVSPEEFIGVAEDIGLIVELGYYIFREACQTYVNWKKKGVDINVIAINISSVQLRQSDAFTQLKKIISDTGIDAKHIEIELTERYIMEYSIEKLTILDDLRTLGCHISIDDFGTGYSSMSYLKRLAIDTIKIDKSFITELPDNQHDAEVSKAIIVLSQSLGYEVIAEGIETAEQELLLESYNCDIGQGYYFAKPMTDADIVAFYHKKETK